MIREIVTYDIDKNDNPCVLTSKTRKIKNFKDKEVQDCIKDLNDTMTALVKKEGNKRGAIGLAAPQIGVDLAMTVVEFSDKRVVFINPKVIKSNGKQRLFRIGCFSLIKYRALVNYNDDVIVEYQNEKGVKKTMRLKGDRSCVVQHEIDHLVGDLLFERLQNKQKDLFIPRQSLYKDGKIPFYNYGPIFELRRRLNLIKPQSSPVYYSDLFNDYSDYKKHVKSIAKEYEEFIKVISKHTKANSRILEIGDNTSAISIYLNNKKYKVTSNQIDDDMLALSKQINKANKASVKYSNYALGKLKFKEKEFETAFSYQLLETLADEDLISTLDNVLRLAKKLIFVVPTIKVKANTLKGSEHLKTIKAWTYLINNQGYKVEDYYEYNDGQYAIFVISK